MRHLKKKQLGRLDKMNKSKCSGCYQDRYNHKGMCERPGIDAPVVSEECWYLENAKMVWKVRIPIHQLPPYTQKAERIPNCYSSSEYAFVEPSRIKKGYIK